MNKTIITAGFAGALIATALWAAARGFDAVVAMRVLGMVAFVLLAARGFRWAAWLIAAWFAVLGLASAVGSFALGGIGAIMGVAVIVLFGGLAWSIVKASNREAAVSPHHSAVAD